MSGGPDTGHGSKGAVLRAEHVVLEDAPEGPLFIAEGQLRCREGGFWGPRQGEEMVASENTCNLVRKR